MSDVTDKVSDTTDKVSDTAEGATDTASDTVKDTANGNGVASGVTGSLKEATIGAFTSAAREILAPAIQQMSQQAAKQAADYAKEEGPRLVKEQVLPRVMEATGADSPGDLAKQGIGKAGEMISDSGGITGLAGKLMSKMGGGKGGGTATGYGAKRRMPIQQDIFISVNVEDAFKAWTEFKRWTEYMHRANLVDPQIEDEEGGSASVKITEKMWGFKRPFTAEVVSQTPNEHIRWKSTEGTKHVGVIAFHSLGDRLTLISVNIDHAPSGPIEKTARGARFVKRAIRADLHRFKGWVEHQSEEEIEEMEGWMGTIEDGQITITHEDEMGEEWGGGTEPQDKEEEDGEESDSGEDEDGQGEGQDEQDAGEGVEEDEESGEEDSEEGEQEDEELEDDSTDDEEDEPQAAQMSADEDEDDEEEEQEDKPLPTPKKRSGGQRKKPAAKRRAKSSS